MASLAEEIQAWVLRSFFPPHSASFERCHTKYPQFIEWLENSDSDTSVILWFFPPFLYTIDAERWINLDKYIKHGEGQEYRSLCRYWARYAKLCLKRCKHCYHKAEGSLEENYAVDRAFAIAGCDKEEDREKIKKKYPEEYEKHLIREARKRKRLRTDVDSFQVAPNESQGSS